MNISCNILLYTTSVRTAVPIVAELVVTQPVPVPPVVLSLIPLEPLAAEAEPAADSPFTIATSMPRAIFLRALAS